MPFPIRVADVMSTPVRTATPDTTATAAAARCIDEEIGSLVVVEDDTVVGIVTNDDLVGLLASETDPGTRPLEAFMSSPVLTIGPDEPVGDAVDRMTDAGVARLVVVEDGKPVGLLSTDDVVHHVPQVFHRHQFEVPDGEHHYSVRRDTAYEESDWEFECVCVSDEAVSVGDRVTFAKTITDEDVRAFADASGDTNRLHLDDAYAGETRFGRRIVHGTLVGGLVSAALARLPGLTIYLSQDLSFLSPVDIGERVTAECTVVESLGRNKYELTTDVYGEDDEQVIEGQAAVLIDEMPESARVEIEAVA